MIEVRWHGRAGQGAKTASQLFAMAELSEGRFVQAFPDYGPERGGAPMRAYTRVDDRRIRRRYGVSTPDAVVVLEPSLLSEVDVTNGLAADGLLLLNAAAPVDGLGWEGDVRLLDAGAIAGPRYVNAVMLGALVGALGEPSLDAVLDSARQLFGRKLTSGALDELTAAITGGSAAVSREVAV